MTPFDAYQTHIAVRAHFSRHDYDAFKYNFKVRGAKRPPAEQAWIWEKVARRNDALEFLVSATLIRPGMHMSQAVRDPDLQFQHGLRVSRVQSLEYLFKNDLDVLKGTHDELTSCDRGHPTLLKDYWGQRVALETVSILMYFTGVYSHWMKSGDFMMQETAHVAKKYWPFLDVSPREETQLLGIYTRRFK